MPRNRDCWLAKLLGLTDCDGPIQRAHLIPKQRLKRAGLDHAAIWDPRVWRLMCWMHHHRFDTYFVRITRIQVPAETEEYALEHGFVWSLDRDFGVRS